MTDKKQVVEDDSLWVHDVNILLQKSSDILPYNGMTFNRKLNATTRFLIIASLILYLMYGEAKVFFAPGVFMIFTFIIFASDDETTDTFVSAGEKVECKKPTINNPFMNLLVSDINSPNGRKQSCDGESVKNEISDNFNSNLYFEAKDIWNKNNSQRQFYSMPNTEAANRQGEFGRWLYGSKPTKKEQHLVN